MSLLEGVRTCPNIPTQETHHLTEPALPSQQCLTNNPAAFTKMLMPFTPVPFNYPIIRFQLPDYYRIPYQDTAKLRSSLQWNATTCESNRTL